MQRIILMRGYDKNNSREREIENNAEIENKREREKKKKLKGWSSKVKFVFRMSTL